MCQPLTQDQATEIASGAARAAGFDVDAMLRRVWRDERGWVVAYLPDRPVLGGDVEITVDPATGACRLLRGQ